MSHKSDAAELFERVLADSRADGVPSTVVIARTDWGCEFRGDKIGDLCRSIRSETGIRDGRQPPIQWSSRARTGFD